jgi:hypothetical protein
MSLTIPRRFLSATFLLPVLAFPSITPEAEAFCGFYVSRADAKLYNKSSQVAVVRHDDKTVISMLNDFEGEMTDFALVVPVPAVLEEGQIHVADKALFEHLDAWSAPRLVEYHDPDPCQVYANEEHAMLQSMPRAAAPAARDEKDRALGVTVEARYTVGEYDIVILSATESGGLETWLIENGYKVPAGARRALQPYIRQGLKFFVARVNLEAQAATGLTWLRPLQFAFESPRFMLPIRLGIANAKGPQDLIVYLLTREGRVETTNYRTIPIPSDVEIPGFALTEFADIYRAMFERALAKEGGRAVFTEYAWNMGWCDPCAADPLSPAELAELGVFWLDDPSAVRGGAVPVHLTRLHVRYTAETFPEDLVFQETGDRGNFQGRYIVRHPWKGSAASCDRARDYFREVRLRQDREAETLAELTGWKLADIRRKMKLSEAPEPEPWWRKLWGGGGRG